MGGDSVVLPGGDIVIPARDASVLVLALRQLRTSVPRARARAQLLLITAEEAVIREQQRQHHQAARTTGRGTSEVLLPAETAPSSAAPAVMGTSDAAAELDLTESRVRQLLRAERLTGWKGPRDVWLIDRRSVTRYGRSGDGTTSEQEAGGSDRGPGAPSAA
jgi:hypothetical protein